MNRLDIKNDARIICRKNWGEFLLIPTVMLSLTAIVGVFTLGIGVAVVSFPAMILATELYYRATLGEKLDNVSFWNILKNSLKSYRFGQIFLANSMKPIITLIPLFAAVLVSLVLRGIISIFTRNVTASVILFVIFLIPAIIFMILLSYGLSMTDYIIMREPEISGIGALKKSYDMMKGKKGSLFVLELSYIGWWLLCLLTLGVLFLWVKPLVTTAKIVFFNDVYSNSPLAGQEENDEVDFAKVVEEARAEINELKNEIKNKTENAQNDVLTCPKCGAKIGKDFVFCEKCGFRVNDAE